MTETRTLEYAIHNFEDEEGADESMSAGNATLQAEMARSRFCPRASRGDSSPADPLTVSFPVRLI